MFKKFFDKFRKSETPSETPKSNRDLFHEIYPLTQDNKNTIERFIKGMGMTANIDDTEYDSSIYNYQSLEFDAMFWGIEEENQEGTLFRDSKFGAVMYVGSISPNGIISKEGNNLDIYRNWIRDGAVQQGGGIILCEDITTPNGLNAYESIIKIPRKETTGMDYQYFLNLRNYKEQKLYQITVKAFELSPTGTRDNLMMHPISDITGLDFSELLHLYRKDPYDSSFEGGNRMNLSESEEVDYLYPFHPLSLIRQKIKPKLLNSVKFIA